jgi:hypothetical protein
MEAAGAAAAGMVPDGAEVAGMVATTADVAIGTLATTDGTAAGDGGVAVLTRGGFSCRQLFQFQFLILRTADTATDRATATGRDMATVLGTGTEEVIDQKTTNLGIIRETLLRQNHHRPLGCEGCYLGACGSISDWRLLGQRQANEMVRLNTSCCPSPPF